MVHQTEKVSVQRDCHAIAIPAGTPATIVKGSEVIITQAMGDSFTVNDKGRLFRVAGRDADALGKEPVQVPQPGMNKRVDTEVASAQIMDQLRTCYDPEIPINIVDLGLIYSVDFHQLLDGRLMVRIMMTLTAAGCGMGAILANDIQEKILAIPGVDHVDVEVVFDPPWSRDMMSDEAKLQLGML